MNRTDRLLAIVLELQGKGERRAADLAALFETSKRTIYRDIVALCEAGVPVRAVPGRGYSLMEGYFLPPLSFTSEEAVTLLLGGDFMAQNFDARYRAAANAAVRKIAAALPAGRRGEVRALQGGMRFIASFGDDPGRPAERRPCGSCGGRSSSSGPSASATTRATPPLAPRRRPCARSTPTASST